MANNEILPFAGTDTGTNLLTQAEYNADSQRPIGNQPGVARSKLVNKALRQTSLISSAIAQYFANRQSRDITDSLSAATLAGYMLNAIGGDTQKNSFNSAIAAGTADAITASYTPAVTALTNGLSLFVRATAANTSTAPTFTPNSGVVTAKAIVKGNNLALVAGDIAGAGHWLELHYDSTLDRWVLQNPAYGIKTVTGGYSGAAQYNVSTTLTASDVGKAIAVGGSGGTMTLPLLSATHPGASMLLFCQGGTAVLTPQGADTLYGGSSPLASLTFKGFEYVEVTNFGSSWVITGGSWLSSALGVNQTWQNVLGSRAIGTAYTNTTGRPIEVEVGLIMVAGQGLQLSVGGTVVGRVSGNSGTNLYQTLSATVPHGVAYSVTYFVGSGSVLDSWAELR